MKVIWEKSDLKCGKIVVCNNGASEKWMIGHMFNKEGKCLTLNSLNDGLVNIFPNNESIISALNESYIPVEMAEFLKPEINNERN